ncbi:MAG: rhodanese-like domain-containing protein [Burkholderiales bacterium]
MDTPEQILARGRERAERMGLPYAGAVTPLEAAALLQADAGAKLVDVRTRAELEWVGRPPGAVFIEWNTWPGGVRNPEFERALLAKAPDKTRPVLFLCRSGGRSHHAAMVAETLGYPLALNVLEGFEGDKDADGHRGTVGGWKVAGLPWIQG